MSDSVWRMRGSFSPHFSKQWVVKHSKNSTVVWLAVEYTLHAAREWRITLSQGYICSHAATAVATVTHTAHAESHYADMKQNRKKKKNARVDRVIPGQIDPNRMCSTIDRTWHNRADLALWWLHPPEGRWRHCPSYTLSVCHACWRSTHRDISIPEWRKSFFPFFSIHIWSTLACSNSCYYEVSGCEPGNSIDIVTRLKIWTGDRGSIPSERDSLRHWGKNGSRIHPTSCLTVSGWFYTVDGACS